MSLSFAIIGCGNIGKRHAEQIQAVGSYRLFAISLKQKRRAWKEYDAEVLFQLRSCLQKKRILM
jgi:predicted dehydrogenase